jgi:xylan 1,4-beta-xylosidase
VKVFLRVSTLSIVWGVLVCAQAGAQEEEPVTIEVDGTRRGSRIEPVWAYFGYDEANYTTTLEGQELLQTLASLHKADVFTRTHFLFNSGDGTPALKWGSTNLYTETDAGEPVYDFTIIDGIMDATTDAGIVPLFEFGFMPEALSVQPDPYRNSGTFTLDGGSFYPPSDYTKWGELVRVWSEHVRERYAAGGAQTNWIWELWNEPDIGYFHGTTEEYGKLFDHTEAALHSIFPEAPLGGPAVASPERPFLQEFLERCANGTNAVSGEIGTRLDFVSFHAKGGVTSLDNHVQLDLGTQLRLHKMGFDTVRDSAFFDKPIIISEADPDGCAACPSTTYRYLDYRNSPAYGAYEVAMMKRSLDLAEETGVQLKGILTWAFTFPGTDYFAGYRELTTNGIHLPVLNAFKMLGRLEGSRLSVQSDGARSLEDMMERGVRDRADIDALGTFDGHRLQVLVWNYHDVLQESPDANVNVRIRIPDELRGRLTMTHRRVDETHGNAFTVWQAQGSPKVPSADELAELRAAMKDLEFESSRSIDGAPGIVNISFQLPRFGLSLIELSLAPTDSSGPAGGGCSCGVGSSSQGPSLWIFLTALLFAPVARRPKRLLH